MAAFVPTPVALRRARVPLSNTDGNQLRADGAPKHISIPTRRATVAVAAVTKTQTPSETLTTAVPSVNGNDLDRPDVASPDAVKTTLVAVRNLMAARDYDGAVSLLARSLNDASVSSDDDSPLSEPLSNVAVEEGTGPSDNNMCNDSSREDPELLRTWACLESSRGDPHRARELFARSVRASRESCLQAAAWNAWALMEQRNGNVLTARKCFESGARADPAHTPLLQAFAVFETKFGSKDRARELFSRAAELQSSPRTWLAWAAFEGQEENLPRARFLYRTAVNKSNASSPDDPSAELAFAKFEERHKNFARAREVYQDVIQRHGRTCAKGLHAWGTFESRAGKFGRARQLFRATLACPGMTKEKSAPTYQAWAISEKRAGNYETARQLFERGAQADPSHAYVWQAWGIMEQHLKQFDDAREKFQRGVSADPYSAPTWNAWARMEASQGNVDEARRLYKRATEADAQHSQSWQAWAVLEGRQGELESARALFKHVVTAHPTCAPAWQAWACMEYKAGHTDVARTLFQKGVNADPSHIAVWQAWADMENEIGEWWQGPACSLPSTLE